MQIDTVSRVPYVVVLYCRCAEVQPQHVRADTKIPSFCGKKAWSIRYLLVKYPASPRSEHLRASDYSKIQYVQTTNY